MALARLLRQDAQLWLLDEPLASLDPRRAQDALAMVLRLAQGPRALLLSLHRPDLLAGFDRVIGLRQGEVSFDLPAANLTDDLLTALYRGHAPSEE